MKLFSQNSNSKRVPPENEAELLTATPRPSMIKLKKLYEAVDGLFCETADRFSQDMFNCGAAETKYKKHGFRETSNDMTFRLMLVKAQFTKRSSSTRSRHDLHISFYPFLG
jgi:hypothetical protein